MLNLKILCIIHEKLNYSRELGVEKKRISCVYIYINLIFI